LNDEQIRSARDLAWKYRQELNELFAVYAKIERPSSEVTQLNVLLPENVSSNLRTRAIADLQAALGPEGYEQFVSAKLDKSFEASLDLMGTKAIIFVVERARPAGELSLQSIKIERHVESDKGSVTFNYPRSIVESVYGPLANLMLF
jgi:hypothetical protein